MQGFLISSFLLAFLVGLPTIVIWLGSNRKLSLQESYFRALLHIATAVGVAAMFVSGLILLFVISDLVGISRFGYPSYSILIIVIAIAIGYGLYRFSIATAQLADQVSRSGGRDDQAKGVK